MARVLLTSKAASSSVSRYLRARELAEQEAKKHIERLNSLMHKRMSKERNIEKS
jgi:hypothetical protein